MAATMGRIALVVSMMCGAAIGMKLDPAFLECLDEKDISLSNITMSYALCTGERSPIPIVGFKSQEQMKQTFPKFCKDIKSQTCLKEVVAKLEPCLNNKNRKVLKNILALELASNKYMCKDNGKEITTLLNDPKQMSCFGEYNENGTCPYIGDWWDNSDFLSLFQEKSCREFVDMIECYADNFRHACEKYDIIEYMEMGIKTALLSTSCRTYFVESLY